MPFQFVVTYGELEIGRARWSWSRRPDYYRSGALRSQRVVVQVSGMIAGADKADYASRLGSARTALVDGRDLKVLCAEEVVHQLLAGECHLGPRITSLAFPRNDSQYAFRQPIEMTVEGWVPAVQGDVVEEEQTYEVQEDQDGLETRRYSGHFVMAEGHSAQEHFPGTVPSTPSGFVRSRKRARYDDVDRRCDYDITFGERDAGLPGGVSTGSVTSSTTTDEQGRVTVRVSGSYRGAGAASAAEAARPGNCLIQEEEISLREPEGEVGFSYRGVRSSKGGLLFWTETVEASGGGQPVEVHRFPGVTPLLMYGIPEAYRIVQRGSAVGYGSYPPAPRPYYPDDLAREGVISYNDRSPSEKEVSWQFEFIFSTNPGGPVRPGRPK